LKYELEKTPPKIPEKAEEIDAPISVISESRGNGDSSEEPVKVAPYYLTGLNADPLGRLNILGKIHDKFSELLQASLSTRMRTRVEVDFISTELHAFGDFIKKFSKPTSFHLFEMPPLSGTALFILVDHLVFSLIDCAFGGKGKPVKQNRDFTLIEKRVIQKLTREMLIDLEKAWNPVLPVRTLLKNSETNPDFIHVPAPMDSVIVVNYSLWGNEFSGNFYICIPYSMVEPFREKLSYHHLQSTGPES